MPQPDSKDSLSESSNDSESSESGSDLILVSQVTILIQVNLGRDLIQTQVMSQWIRLMKSRLSPALVMNLQQSRNLN